MKTKLIQTEYYLLLIDEEAEIKDKGYRVDLQRNTLGFVDCDEYYNRLENRGNFGLVIAYFPLTEGAKELDLPLLPDSFTKHPNFSDWYENQLHFPQSSNSSDLFEEEMTIQTFKWDYMAEAFEAGKLFLSDKQFSLEDMIGFAKYYILNYAIPYELDVISGKITDEQKIQMLENDVDHNWNELAQKYIQSLSTQQLPKEFDLILNDGISDVPYSKIIEINGNINWSIWVIKTITNSEGKKVLIGEYKY